MTNDEKRTAALKFLTVLGKPDASVLESVATPDVVWSFPGSSPISGEARGVDAIMKRATIIAGHQVKVEVIHATYSRAGGISVILHNTAAPRNDRILDEHICAVFAFADRRISRLDTYLSDVAMAEAYFA